MGLGSTVAVGDAAAPRACAICGARESSCWLAHAPDYVTADDFSVWRCGICDVAATVPQPVSLDPYYAKRYRRYNRAVVSLLRWHYRRRAGRWVRMLGAPGVALEVGCGEGWMLDALRAEGWRVVGFERTFDALRQGRSADRTLPMFVGSLDAIRPGAQFDAVVLFQVLEHVSTPMEVLSRCAALLKPGGTLIVGVPNARSWQARMFGAHWFHLDVPRHLFHFSPGALAWALHEVGLRPDPPTFASFEHDPYGWVQSGLNRLGFAQNMLTTELMGAWRPRRSSVTLALVSGLAALMAVPSVVVAACSWMASAGAIMEIHAKKPA